MNLLPPAEKENLKKGLRVRLIIASSLLVAGAFLAGFVLLLPSYFLSLGNFSRTGKENHSLTVQNEDLAKEIMNLPQEINLKLDLLKSNLAEVSVFESFEKILTLLPQEVKLDSVVFLRDQLKGEEKGSTIVISGTALNREALVSFSNLLKQSDLFSAVDTPVSSLAKDKNLPFSIKIFIKTQ